MAFSFGDHWGMFYITSLIDENNDNSIHSTYASRTVFDIIVEGIKQKNTPNTLAKISMRLKEQ